MNEINIKGFILKLDFEPQISPSGRPMRLSSIGKNLKVPQQYIDKVWKNHWFYTFRFLDAPSEFIKFEFDYFGNYVQTIKN